MEIDSTYISAEIQRQLKRRGLTDTTAPQAARWLDEAGKLRDRPDRAGAPLRVLLRNGEIAGATKEGRYWRIRLII